MYYLGIDAGTSSMKCMIINNKKEILYENSCSYEYNHPTEGYKEIHPKKYLEALKKMILEIPNTINLIEIESICITGQMHTTVFLDEVGNSIRPAILWNDTRMKNKVQLLKEELSDNVQTQFISKSISTGCMATSLLWVKENEPNNYKQISKVCSVKDYLTYQLTGRFCTDFCDASTSSLYDISNKCYSSYMLNKLEISEDKLCEVYPSGYEVGTLTQEWISEYKINRYAKVRVGTGDNPASAIACDIIKNKEPLLSFGTSGVIIVPRDDKEFCGKGKNVLFSKDGKQFSNIVQGSLQAAGATHLWWVKRIIQSNDLSIDQDIISDDRIGKNTVRFFPYMNGDKTVYADPNLRGSFIGLDLNTKRSDMLLAIFEGISYATRLLIHEVLQGNMPKRIKVNGGGSKSDVWMQVLSHVLNCEIEVYCGATSPCYGACLIAWEHDHNVVDKEERILSKKFFPNSKIAKLYDKQFDAFLHMYNIMKQFDKE
ncbi:MULTISPECIES: FGGY family carbohydrate kinase [unclassified Breznakia]|uniref:xylulokinase n=1 Tax=unclassified Breznakia TaxID=2623764 RepID=UPI002476D4C7|nr:MULTISPECIES: FGGY family carbohydrate kinase [unclassified Breznakia]